MKKRNPEIQLAHDALQNVDRSKVVHLIKAVNLTAQEKFIIVKSEIEGIRIKDIVEQLNLSPDSVMRIKTKGMRKIYNYINQLNSK
jgi:DNA-directed RNA polymerase specialized sigma subunit